MEIRSRRLAGIRGMNMHVLEAGVAGAQAKLIVLLHGFPELAYSWRKIMPSLAAAGYYVVAPDQRGFGASTGWSSDYDTDLTPFRMTSLAADVAAMVSALGFKQAHCLVGHDFGSPVAAWTALLYPDLCRSLCLMSAPFGGPPAILSPSSLAEGLAALVPPRKHYQSYFSTRQANTDLMHAPQGLANFLREYYFVKSASWAGNTGMNSPAALAAPTPTEFARLPQYYVMLADKSMPDTVSALAPTEAQIPLDWLSEEELLFYTQNYSCSGFQGGLNWYRCATDPSSVQELRGYEGRRLTVPTMFVAGESDWGIVQKPGELARMQTALSTDWRGTFLLKGAGHWVQQERPQEVVEHLLRFCALDD